MDMRKLEAARVAIAQVNADAYALRVCMELIITFLTFPH